MEVSFPQLQACVSSGPKLSTKLEQFFIFTLFWIPKSLTFLRLKIFWVLRKEIRSFLVAICDALDWSTCRHVKSFRSVKKSVSDVKITYKFNECIERSGTTVKTSRCSILPIYPVLFKLSFAGTHSSINMYFIFRFEPLHVLSLWSEEISGRSGILFWLCGSSVGVIFLSGNCW